MVKLTKKDWKLLYELEKDARRPLKDIAKSVKMSKQLVSYMMKKYEKAGLIITYTALIDNSKLGYYNYRVYFKFRKVNTKKEKEALVNFISDQGEGVIVNTIEGRWDCGTCVSVKNIYDFYRYWDRIMAKREFIEEYKVCIYSPIHYFTRTMIAPNPKKEIPKTMIIGGNKEVAHDEIDISILEELAKNVRTPLIKLSEKLCITPQRIARRIKRMEETGIIQGYRPLFDWNSLGYEYYKIDMKLQSFSCKKKLFNFCREHPNIIQVDQTIGGSDFEFEVFVKNLAQLKEVVGEIENEFKKDVENYTYFRVGEAKKETFMSM